MNTLNSVPKNSDAKQLVFAANASRKLFGTLGLVRYLISSTDSPTRVPEGLNTQLHSEQPKPENPES
jgi:hypothetical protein